MRFKVWLSAILEVVLFYANSFTSVSIDRDTWISETAQQACIKYGEEYNICPELLEAIIETESWGVSDVTNKDCIGLMQVSKIWHKDRMKKLGVTDLFDEESNIHVGTDYLYDLFVKYEDPAVVLMEYHGESNALQKAEQGIVSDYAKGILERSAELEELHELESGGVG